MLSVTVIVEGKPYPNLRLIAGPPPYEDCGFFLALEDGFTWIFAINDPTPEDIEAIRHGPLSFHLVVEPPALCMIGVSPVLTAERAFQVSQNRERLPTPAPNAIKVYAIDAKDGKVLVVRKIGASQSFVDSVARVINKQPRHSISEKALDQAEELLQSRSVEENLQHAVASYEHRGRQQQHPGIFNPPMSGSLGENPLWNVGIGPGRPMELVRSYEAAYPGIWQRVDELRQDRWWDKWCFLPISKASALLQGNIDLIVGGIILASWRLSKGIYTFDPELARALEQTAVSRVPTEVLFRMPEQCVYVPVAWSDVESPLGPVHGFFAQLQLNERGAIPQLALCFDTSRGCILSLLTLSPNGNIAWGSSDLAASMMKIAQRSLSLLIYLCAENPDIDGTPLGMPEPVTTKMGLRWFPREKITAWNVGVRLGAKLRAARELVEAEEPAAGEDKTRPHGRPRPHVRVGHFHHFWTGPRSEPENRKLICRWVHSALVNARGANDLVVTVRPVDQVPVEQDPAPRVMSQPPKYQPPRVLSQPPLHMMNAAQRKAEEKRQRRADKKRR